MIRYARALNLFLLPAAYLDTVVYTYRILPATDLIDRYARVVMLLFAYYIVRLRRVRVPEVVVK